MVLVRRRVPVVARFRVPWVGTFGCSAVYATSGGGVVSRVTRTVAVPLARSTLRTEPR